MIDWGEREERLLAAAQGLVDALYRERGRLGTSAPLSEERVLRSVLDEYKTEMASSPKGEA